MEPFINDHFFGYIYMFEFKFKGLKMNKIEKANWEDAQIFEFEFKGLEMNKNWEIKVRESKCMKFDVKG